MSNRNRFGILGLLVLIGFLSSCNMIEMLMSLPTDGDTSSSDGGDSDLFSKAVVLEADSFTLEWEYDDIESISSFVVFYRLHDTETWNQLTSVDSTGPLECNIDTSMIEKGLWDFGIVPVQSDGLEGPMHISLDENAIPELGWYLDWK